MARSEEGSLRRADITDRLPRFRLIKSLATTSMSEVYLAEETTEPGRTRPVALKVVFPDRDGHPNTRARFRQECEVMLNLKHPNIAPAFDAGESADHELCYLTMPYFDGDLAGVLRERGPLSLKETLVIARQVADALDYAHLQKLVHRDVKPRNILVELAHRGTKPHRIKRVYLSDFGVVKDHARTTLTSHHPAPYTPGYAAPEQTRVDGPIGPVTDVHALGQMIRECLTTHQYEGHGAVELPSEVNRALQKATSVEPGERYATCGELIKDLESGVRARQLRRALVAAAVALPALALAGVVLWSLLVDAKPPEGPQAQEKQALPLGRVTEALRDRCKAADRPAALAAADSALTCRDADGQAAEVALFADGTKAGNAYARTVEESGVADRQGDCGTASGAEHRYPATGTARGRVLCYVRDGVSVVAWTDDRSRTVSRAEAPAGEDKDLRRRWAAWVGAYPAFPTAAERTLTELAAGTHCERVPAAGLEAVPAATAGLRCVPWGSGARSVDYYQFTSLAELRKSLGSQVTDAKAPVRASCAAGKAPGFLGTQRHDWLRVDVGQVLCRPEASGAFVMEWSMEPLLIEGRVTGSDAEALAGWWSGWHLAPLGRIVDAINRLDGFPTPPEEQLLRHIPSVSRKNCVRASPEQVWQDIGAVSAVGVVCGRTSGARLVAYYQFENVATMRYAFGSSGDDSETACTRLPDEFAAETGYSRGGSTGRLRCGVVDGTGERYLEWTDERLAIAGFAHEGAEPFVLIDWWTHDAGPIQAN